MQSMGCHDVSEQLMPAGATEDDVNKISQVMAQTVRTLEAGSAAPELGPEAHSLPCEVVGSDEEFSNGVCVPGFGKMDTEGQEATKRSLSNAITDFGSVGFVYLRHLSCVPSCRGFSYTMSFCQVFMCTRVCLPQGPLSLCLRSFL